MKKAISYVRYSSKEQAKGDSYRRQLKAAEDYCLANGLDLDETVLDSGVSAFKGANAAVGALSNLIADVDAGRVAKGTTLIIESLDRLSRMEVEKALMLLLELVNEKELIVVTLSDNKVYEKGKMDMITLMTSLVVMSRAHEESAMKSRRLGAVWSKKKDQAREGQLMSVRIPTWLKIVDGKCEVIPEKADAVKQAFELMASGFGVGATLRRLNLAGVNAPSGRPWASTSLKRLIETQAVIGNYQPHTTKGGVRVPVGDIIKGYYPAIVDEDLYWNVRHKHKINEGNNGVRKEIVSNLFSGLAVCAVCGSPLRFYNKGPVRGGQYLACRSRVEGRGCDLPYMHYDQIERVVLVWLHYEGVSLMAPKASEIDFDALAARLEENLKAQDRVVEAIAKIGFNEALQNQLQRLDSEAGELRARLQERPLETDLKQEFAELVESVKGADGRRQLVRQIKRLGVRLKIGVDTLEVVGKVKFNRTYSRGVWYWRGTNGQTLALRMAGYEQRIKGLKPNWGNYVDSPKEFPKGDYWDEVVSYPSHTRLIEELFEEE
jgi:DNA invertase Pin-like site-specific DNA recombinase